MLTLYNSLTDAEIKAILDYASICCGCLSRKYPKAPLEHILRFWNIEKEPLFKMFGEKLILSKEVEIQKDVEDLKQEIDRNCIENYDYFVGEYTDFLFEELLTTGCITNEQFAILVNIISADNLVSNIYTQENFSFTYKENKVQIQKGMKIIKILHKIIDLTNDKFMKTEFENFRLVHSVILNQKALKGKLCLSIHPLDYLTMSDNDCGWHTCMSWFHDGEFRLGTIEMMNSPYVVVAYLTAKEDMVLTEDFYWNNKKWRELFIVTDKVISEIKSYPYVNKALTKYALNWLKDLAENYYDFFSSKITEIEDGDEIVSGSEFSCDIYFDTDRMYNDIKRDNYYFSSYINENIDWKNFCKKQTKYNDFHYHSLKIQYSGKATCMCCGDIVNRDRISSDGIYCHKCDDKKQCPYCYSFYDEDEEFFNYDNQEICSHCYEIFTFTCDLDNERYDSVNKRNLYIYKNGHVVGKRLYYVEKYEPIIKELFGEITIKPKSSFNVWGTVGIVHFENFNLDEIFSLNLNPQFKRMLESLKEEQIDLLDLF